jgi:hypothetical protein
MNWKLGAFRLWLAVSVLWVCGIGYLAYKQPVMVTTPPGDKIIEQGATKAIECVGYIPNTDNYSQVIEDLKAADKVGNTSEAKRLAKIASRHWMCEGTPADGSFVQEVNLSDGPNNTWVATIPTVAGSNIVLNDIPKSIDGPGLAQRIFVATKDLQRSETYHTYAWKAEITILPPIGLLLAGLVFAWIVAGFKEKSSKHG